MTKKYIIASILVIFSTPTIAQTNLTTACDTIIQNYQKLMTEHHIVGGALVVLQPDKIILESHYGLANEQTQTPADQNTIYAWGSITKTLTCIAIMQLQQKGLLDIDDPVVKYIPTFKNINNPYHNTDQITLKMLMSHTAGLQNASFIIPLSWHRPWPRWEQLEPVFNYITVEHEPGTKFSYSNLSLLLVGRVIEIVTHDDYEVYIDKNIFKPLQMYQSYFDATPYHLLPQKAQGYYPHTENQPRRLYHPDIDQGVTTSNGGLKSSINDFKKYLRFLLGSDDPQLQKRYNIVLPRDILESLWLPVHPFSNPDNGAICLGFHNYTDLTHPYIGHTGSANGFISLFNLHLPTKTAFFLTANTANVTNVHTPIKKQIDQSLIPILKQSSEYP
ncbi:MAG: beta-lactamase family protein [Planctomycetes bacterium]|nr:beta-lactamase family protein [Planctomycetota bacterium]